MRLKSKLVAPVLGLLALAACAHPRTITADELRSKFLSAISVTSETELFTSQIENDRTTQQFQAGHASYLRQEAARLSQELSESRIDSAHTHNLTICLKQLDLLMRELPVLQTHSDDQAALAATRERIGTIRKSLEAAKAGL
jgi:TolA-binding protein